jgi:hypothetical protein
MTFGKSLPKLSLSFNTRRIRLGMAHHGSPSAWTAPTKDVAPPSRVKDRKTGKHR